MTLAAALIYWVIVAVWTTVLTTIAIFYLRNPRAFGTTRLLLTVLAVDTFRNIVENTYFGAYFGAIYGLFPAEAVGILGRPTLLIVPKVLNVAAGAVVLGLLLLRWLPLAVAERQMAEQRATDLESIARIDALTGIANRRHFLELAEIEWNRFQRYGSPLSLLLIDVDHFKSINDAYGHQAGDRALVALAQICAGTKRFSDTVGRIGGDEFAALLPETTIAQARKVAERWIAMISREAVDADGRSVRMTVSVGASQAGGATPDFAALIKQADEALYRAKAAGRNCVRSALAEPDQQADADYQISA